MSDKQKRTLDLAQIKLSLRKDLEFTRHSERGRSCRVVYDPVRTRYYRMGEGEYSFARLLDGSRTVVDAIRLSASGRESTVSPEDLLTMARWLLESGLAGSNEIGAEALNDAKRRMDSQLWIQRLNLIFIRLPLFDPDRMLRKIAPFFGWMFSKAGLMGWILLCVTGLGAVLSNPAKAAASAAGVFAPGSWVLLGLAWVLLKLLHELAHGVALSHYGQRVREFGVLFILFVPIGYTDASSAWKLPSKRERIIVAAAGMYAELAVAAIAALVWSLTPDANTMFVAFNVMFAASITTVVFNINPLMRFDGYYILSDLIESPNLYTNGAHYFRYFIRRYILGFQVHPPACLERGRPLVIRLYGICAFFWRILVLSTLLVSASAIAPGVGPVVAVLAAAVWFGPGLWRMVSSFPHYRIASRVRFVLGSIVAVALIVGAWLGVERIAWPGYISAPGYVEYTDAKVVRPGTVGFVKSCHVVHGAEVSAGDLVMVLDNEDLRAVLEKTKLDLESTRLRSRVYYHGGDLAASQIEEQRAIALERRCEDLQEDVESLIVKSPAAGRIVAPALGSMPGRFVTPSDILFSVVDESRKEVRFSIAQEDVELARSMLGEEARIQIKQVGLNTIFAPISDVQPEATSVIPHPALSSLGGGRLAVRKRPGEQMSWRRGAGHHMYELMSARFTGVLGLEVKQSEALRSGQVCKVSFRSGAQSIHDRISILFNRWLESKRGRR